MRAAHGRGACGQWACRGHAVGMLGGGRGAGRGLVLDVLGPVGVAQRRDRLVIVVVRRPL